VIISPSFIELVSARFRFLQSDTYLEGNLLSLPDFTYALGIVGSQASPKGSIFIKELK